MAKEDKLTIRMDIKTKKDLKELADRQNRTMSNYIERLVLNQIEKEKGNHIKEV